MMMERRKGGETGVKAVTCLTGKDVWKAGDAGRWSWDCWRPLSAAAKRSIPATSASQRRQHDRASSIAMPARPF